MWIVVECMCLGWIVMHVAIYSVCGLWWSVSWVDCNACGNVMCNVWIVMHVMYVDCGGIYVSCLCLLFCGFFAGLNGRNIHVWERFCVHSSLLSTLKYFYPPVHLEISPCLG